MKVQINLVVYFKGGDHGNYPFNVPEYKKSYLDFFKYAHNREKNINCYVTRDNSYIGNGLFLGGSKYNPEVGGLEEYLDEIHADIIYDKGSIVASTKDKGNIINHPKFNMLCKDKVRSAHIFPDLFPESIHVKEKDDLDSVAKLLDTEKIVVKPLTGQEGKDIVVMYKKDIAKFKNVSDEDLVVQEYLETDSGIKNITNERHDLRVLIMNGEIVQVYIRIPEQGKYIANVSQGAELREVDVEDLPSDILDAVKKVESKFLNYHPRIYSIDFGYTEDGPKIFEFNSQPGLPYPSWEKYYKVWHEKLFETLLSSIKR